MSERPTPETDAKWQELCCSDLNWYHIAENIKTHCQEMQRERDEARESLKHITEYGTEEINAVVELRQKLASALVERDEAREENAKLRDIAEWAIDNIFHKCTEDLIRAELKELKQLK
jgi:hypothetical protein